MSTLAAYSFPLSHSELSSPTHFLQPQLDWLVSKGKHLNGKAFCPLHSRKEGIRCKVISEM